MNYTHIFRKMFLCLMVMGMGLLLYPGNPVASSKEKIDFDRFEPIELNAVISKINLREAYLIVGEKKIYIIEFKVGKKRFKTSFVNQRGQTSHINTLKTSAWEGKRVMVKGLRLSNGDIVAGIIKKMP